MTGGVFCMQCRGFYTSDEVIEHQKSRCARITCPVCEVDMPVTLFQQHPCIELHLSSVSTPRMASASTEKRNRRSPSSVPHPSMGRRAHPPARVAPPSLDQGA